MAGLARSARAGELSVDAIANELVAEGEVARAARFDHEVALCLGKRIEDGLRLAAGSAEDVDRELNPRDGGEVEHRAAIRGKTAQPRLNEFANAAADEGTETLWRIDARLVAFHESQALSEEQGIAVRFGDDHVSQIQG